MKQIIITTRLFLVIACLVLITSCEDDIIGKRKIVYADWAEFPLPYVYYSVYEGQDNPWLRKGQYYHFDIPADGGEYMFTTKTKGRLVIYGPFLHIGPGLDDSMQHDLDNECCNIIRSKNFDSYTFIFKPNNRGQIRYLRVDWGQPGLHSEPFVFEQACE